MREAVRSSSGRLPAHVWFASMILRTVKPDGKRIVDAAWPLSAFCRTCKSDYRFCLIWRTVNSSVFWPMVFHADRLDCSSRRRSTGEHLVARGTEHSLVLDQTG